MSDFTKWVATELDEDTHRELYNRATVLGQHPKKLMADYIKRGLEGDAEEDDASFSLRLYKQVQKTRARESVKSQLEQLAWKCVKASDEEEMDVLKGLCDEAGYTIDEIIDNVKDYRSMPVVNYDDGSGVAAAMIWLQDLLSKGQRAANTIFDLGEKQGFSRYVVKDAKRRLGVKSIRQPKYWVWTLEEVVVEGSPI